MVARQHEVQWIEYDVAEIDVYEDSNLPALDQEFFGGYYCDRTNCRHGDLYARSKEVDNGTTVKVTPTDILNQLRDKRHENELYIIQQNGVNTFNEANPTAEPMKNLPLPEPYEGDTFDNTDSIGGYGAPTAGSFWYHPGQQAQYKPFGTLGQGYRNDRSLVLDTSDQERVMILSLKTIDSVHNGEADWDDDPTYDNLGCDSYGDYSYLSLGAYPFQPFDMDDFRVPSQADAKAVPMDDAAAALAAGSLAAGLAMYFI